MHQEKFQFPHNHNGRSRALPPDVNGAMKSAAAARINIAGLDYFIF
jgi:hypothetical protein